MTDSQALLFDLREAGPIATVRRPGSKPTQSVPDTRRAALDRTQRTTAPSLRNLMLQILEQAGQRGCTINELSARAGVLRGRAVSVQSTCGRLGELRAAGLVADSGRRRRGSAGVMCVAWVCVGADQVQERPS